MTRVVAPCIPGGGECYRLKLSWGSRDLTVEHARLVRGGLLWTEGPLAALGDFIDTETIGKSASLASSPVYRAATALLPKDAFAIAYRAGPGKAGYIAGAFTATKEGLRYDFVMKVAP